MIIAVDGPAAAGKGTIARALASHYGYHFLDTGSLYRMVGLSLLRSGQTPDDAAAAEQAARKLNPKSFGEEELRSQAVGEAASQVAVIPAVRLALLDLQRAFARQGPGAVLDGRDIGTVVCPDAEVKLFITASPEVRAKRRQQELAGRGEAISYEETLAEIKSRDERDASRKTAPLVAAKDAVILDTSALDAASAIAAAIALVEKKKLSSGRPSS